MSSTTQQAKILPADWRAYGQFDDQRNEFIITEPHPPLPWDNYLFNDRYLAVTDHFGRGWSKLHTRHGQVTFLWHLSAMFERDDNRIVYLRDDDTGQFWSLAGHPVGPVDQWRCRHGLGYSVIESTAHQIAGSMRISVPPGEDPVELWEIELANQSDRLRSLSVFTFGQVSLRGAMTHGYIHFCRGDYDAELGGLFFQLNAPGLPHDRYRAFAALDAACDSWSASRNAFRGTYGTVAAPQAMADGQCANMIASREPMAACLHKRIALEPGDSTMIRQLSGIVNSVDQAQQMIKAHLLDAQPNRIADQLTEIADSRTASPRISSPDAHIDRLVNVWTRQQVALGAGWGRWGWRGYRDIVQQTHGATYFDLPRVRANLIEAMTWQMRDGFAVRGWAPFSPKRYADSALWLCYTANDYVKESGEIDFVHQPVPFRDGGAAPVWDHLLRGCEKAFTDTGPQGLPLIHQGDWNDSLSAVGEKGIGQSVWIAQALCWALGELVELFEAAGLHDQARKADEWKREMADRVNTHAWTGEWYCRGFCDNGKPLGSPGNKQGRIYLNTQTWAILGDVADHERRTRILDAVEQHLRVPYGYLTLAPAYSVYDPDIGRITGMPPGTGENAAVYVHANAFFYAALLKVGQADRALELLRTIHPCNKVNPTSVSGATPYALPNSYYGPGYTIRPGRIEGSWVTGSAGWFMHQTVEHLCGVHRTHQGLRIQPNLPTDWPEVTVTRRFRGVDYKIMIRRDDRVDKMAIEADGQSIDGHVLSSSDQGSPCEVLVRLPR